MSNGAGWRSAVLVGEQAAKGTAASSLVSLPRVSESVASTRGFEAWSAPNGDRSVLFQHGAVPEHGGGITTFVHHSAVGWLWKWFFGGATSAALPGSITATPTATPQAGGTVPDGTYFYQVANVYTRNADGSGAKRRITNPIATAAAVLGGGSNKALVAWANGTAPSGYALARSFVYRTAAGGAAGTAKFLAAVAGGATSYLDDGSAALSAIPIPSPAYRHTFTPSNVALQRFTYLKNQDVGTAQRFVDCRMDSWSISSPDRGRGIAEIEWALKGLFAESAAEGAPSFEEIEHDQAWRFRCLIAGTSSSLVRQWSARASNGLQYLPHGRGNGRHRDVWRSQRCEVSGSLLMQQESLAEWTRLVNGTAFALLFHCDGPPVSTAAAVAAENATAWLVQAAIDLPACRYAKAGAPQRPPAYIAEPLDFVAEKDATAGYHLRTTVDNATASYPNA